MPNLRPTPMGTAIAWLSTFMPAVASNLPALDSWPVLSAPVRTFTVVPMVVGGSSLDTPLRVPIVQVETWAAVPGSDKLQLGAAEQQAEEIVTRIYADPFVPVLVRQRTGYDQALVQSARLLTEPRRLDDPDTGYARFVMDMELAWVRVPE